MKPEDCMLTVKQVGDIFEVSPDTARRRLSELGVVGEGKMGERPKRGAPVLYPADQIIAKLREHNLERQARKVERRVAEMPELAS